LGGDVLGGEPHLSRILLFSCRAETWSSAPSEGGSNFLYRMKTDGTRRRKIAPDRILDIVAVSPDGRWAVAGPPDPNEVHTASVKAFPVDGGPLVLGHVFVRRHLVKSSLLRKIHSALR
jgi:hypothetical protein